MNEKRECARHSLFDYLIRGTSLKCALHLSFAPLCGKILPFLLRLLHGLVTVIKV